MGQHEIVIHLEQRQLLLQTVFALAQRVDPPPTAATRWRMSRLSRLQSIGGSLRLPLLQNGACDFRLTPLLSILMLVTQTWREIVSLLPRFRIVAMSMQRLQVRRARITVVTIDMVHLNPVVMLEEQPTTATASVLLFEQPGQSCTDVGVSALSRAPVDPVPIIGTAVALDLHMPGNGHLAVGQQVPASGSVAEVAKVRRVPTRCQYRRMAQAVDFLGCRQRAQWRSLIQVR